MTSERRESVLDVAGWLESTPQRDPSMRRVKKVRGGKRARLTEENLQSFLHVGYRNIFQGSQHNLQGERESEPKVERGSTSVHRFFPEKVPGHLMVVSSESVGAVNGPKIQNKTKIKTKGDADEKRWYKFWGEREKVL